MPEDLAKRSPGGCLNEGAGATGGRQSTVIQKTTNVAALIGPSPKARHHCLHHWVCRSPVALWLGWLLTARPRSAPVLPTVPAAIFHGQLQQHRVHQRCERAVRAEPHSSLRRPPQMPWVNSMTTRPRHCHSPSAAGWTRWLAALDVQAIDSSEA